MEELKDLSSLALDELIGNLKVHEVVMKKDSKIYKGKKERVKSIALKAKKESSDDETLTSGSDDEEYAMAVRNFKKFFRRKGKFVRQPCEEKKSFRQRDDKKGKSDRKGFRCGDLNHLIGDCPKPPRNKDQKAFVGGCWSDSENEAEDKTNDETYLMAQSSNEVTPDSSHYSDNASSLDNDSMQNEYDNLCEINLKIINKNKNLKTKRELLEKEILELNEKIKKLERNKEVDIGCESYQQLRLENAKLKENQVKFVKFDKSANSLREMLNIQKSPSCKIGLGFDKSKASTSGTKPISFVESAAELAGTDPPYMDPWIRRPAKKTSHKKGDWPYKKEKNEGELPKKDKGVLLRSPTKGKKRAYIRSPSKKGVQGQSSTDKEKAKELKQLLDTNPGSSVHLHVDELDNVKSTQKDFMSVLGHDRRVGVLGSATTTIQHTFYSKMNLIGNIDPEAKQWLVDRNLNSWCRAFFKMDRGCAAYENGISESYHNAIRIARGGVKRCEAGSKLTDPTGSEASYAGDTGFMNKDETVTEDPIEESQVDDIPTQQSKTSQKTAKIIEDAIATGKLKTAGLKRRCKSERIAKRAKPFQFGKDGAGSCADKAWDVDEVLAKE
ncbi:hypothetical protein Tco_0066356 [Tanacetum coccineum]